MNSAKARQCIRAHADVRKGAQAREGKAQPANPRPRSLQALLSLSARKCLAFNNKNERRIHNCCASHSFPRRVIVGSLIVAHEQAWQATEHATSRRCALRGRPTCTSLVLFAKHIPTCAHIAIAFCSSTNTPAMLRSFVLGALAVSSYVPAAALNNGLGRTPVMGWNR